MPRVRSSSLRNFVTRTIRGGSDDLNRWGTDGKRRGEGGGGECKIYLTGGKFVAYTEISDPFKFAKTIVKTGWRERFFGLVNHEFSRVARNIRIDHDLDACPSILLYKISLLISKWVAFVFLFGRGRFIRRPKKLSKLWCCKKSENDDFETNEQCEKCSRSKQFSLLRVDSIFYENNQRSLSLAISNAWINHLLFSYGVTIYL